VHESTWAVLFLALAGVLLIGFWFAPGGVLALRRIAKGELQVDVRPGYGPETLFRLLDAYGVTGRRSFRTMLYLDMVFPAIYATALFLIGDRIAAAHAIHGALQGAARCMGIAAAAFDYLENTLLLKVLNRYPQRSVGAARAAGIATSLKGVSFAGVLAAFLLAGLAPLR
jgi:hypothetical protein